MNIIAEVEYFGLKPYDFEDDNGNKVTGETPHYIDRDGFKIVKMPVRDLPDGIKPGDTVRLYGSTFETTATSKNGTTYVTSAIRWEYAESVNSSLKAAV